MNAYANLRAAERVIGSQGAATSTGVDRGAGEQAGARDAAAFDRLLAEQYPRIARLVERLSGWSGDRDDLTQEVFVAAWQAWARFRAESRPETWLVRIAINKCRTHRRRQWLRRAMWNQLTAIARLWEPQTQHVGLEQDENNKQVREAIQRLPQRDREALVLRYLEDLAIDDIAASLEITRGAVEVRLSRARARLKMLFGAAGETSG